ncbi:MAG TPA: hypothetical protein VMH02_06855 [Verrucomicrobiae bacterium]|nr:hypothetical protein [Verrucomicrobiae bacterium]
MKRSLFLLLACTLTAAAPRAAQSPPSAQDFYVAAIRAMGNLPEPRYVSYTLTSQSDGLTVYLRPIDGLVWLAIEAGTQPQQWVMLHRTNDFATRILDKDGKVYVSGRSFFDPTWYGTFRALRDGMLGTQDDAAPLPAAATPLPETTPIPTIAVVRVMGPAAYNVFDRGAAACPNGDPGHALHLSPKKRADGAHQLSDAIVDLRTMRFCMLRFGYGFGFGFDGIVEQHYADVGGYWMVTGGVIDGTLRAFGISTHHGMWRYRLTGMTFPSALPAQDFEVSPAQR